MITTTIVRAAGVLSVTAAAALVLAACSQQASSPTSPATTAATTAAPVSSGVPAATGPDPGSGTGTAPSGSVPAAAGSSAAAGPAAAGPDPAAVDRRNPDAVGRAFVQLAWTMDTRTDTGPAQAGRRAAALATPTLAGTLGGAVDQGAPGQQWATWAAHQAVTSVALAPNADTPPHDTPTTVYRSWAITLTPRGRGWTGPTVSLVAYLTVTNLAEPGAAARWAVADLKVAQ